MAFVGKLGLFHAHVTEAHITLLRCNHTKKQIIMNHDLDSKHGFTVQKMFTTNNKKFY